LSKWNNLPITLEVDHIDGNASNNLPSNLRLVCPNCHSQTSTWKGGNKGKGRKSLGLPLH
jgi:5-methylcytosine-specific restriction endonuclease McrA